MFNLYVRGTYTFISKLNKISFVNIQEKLIWFEPLY
jgi:hypothetical protein